ncbi:hypothetical protein MLD38_013881 [Melastoma candidum]|uniref:Uncharacterized protein n=1 Tax=Melastoma candidum TaxID=119954 RepID=A0ACB9RJG0_9MYRT|nr:hypothetical protein MLD38_013881 [Melastoma candidum]
MSRCSSDDAGELRSEDHLLARDGESHVVVEPKLLFGLSEETLEFGVIEDRDGNNVPSPVLPDIDGKVAFGNIEGEAVLVVADVDLFAQAGAPLEDLLEDGRVRQLVQFPVGHTCK